MKEWDNERSEAVAQATRFGQVLIWAELGWHNANHVSTRPLWGVS